MQITILTFVIYSGTISAVAKNGGSWKMWAHSSAGRASALQAEGHRFEPYCAHHIYGPVVQLVRMPACHAGGRGFEPHPDRQLFLCRYASVAQSVEQRTENPRVGGSIPPGGTIHIF